MKIDPSSDEAKKQLEEASHSVAESHQLIALARAMIAASKKLIQIGNSRKKDSDEQKDS